MIEFFVPGVPQPGGSKRGFVNRKTGKVIITEDAKRNKEWRSLVAYGALKAMGEDGPLKGPLSLEIKFLVSRPKGHYGTGRNAGYLKKSAPQYPTTRPDVTKLVRSTEDALTGIVWGDDAQVVLQTASKHYTQGTTGALVMVETLYSRGIDATERQALRQPKAVRNSALFGASHRKDAPWTRGDTAVTR